MECILGKMDMVALPLFNDRGSPVSRVEDKCSHSDSYFLTDGPRPRPGGQIPRILLRSLVQKKSRAL